MSNFLIAPSNASLFRVKISNVQCELDKGYLDSKGMFIEGNFDMFRTFVTNETNSSTQFPQWDTFEIMFRREIDGTFVTDFIGEAEVDLMTLATGPDSVVIRLRNGDAAVGRLLARVEMEEIAEMKAEIKNVVFTDCGQSDLFDGKAPTVQLSKKGRLDMLVVDSKEIVGGGGGGVGAAIRAQLAAAAGGDAPHRVLSPVGTGTQRSYAVPDCEHFYSTSLPDISENASLVIDICKRGWLGRTIVGTVELSFSDFLWMIERHRDPNGLRKKMRAAEREMDEADVRHSAAEVAMRKAKARLTAYSAELQHRDGLLYRAQGVLGSTLNDGPPVSDSELASLQKEVEDAEDILLVAKQQYNEASTAAAETVKDPTSGWFSFSKQQAGATTATNGTTGGGETVVPVEVRDPKDESRVIGALSGECHLSFMPRYCQMRAGVTVDGVVCNGVMYSFATIEPPFKSKEHRLKDDMGEHFA